MFLLENRAIRVPARAWVWRAIYPSSTQAYSWRQSAWDRALQAVEGLCSS